MEISVREYECIQILRRNVCLTCLFMRCDFTRLVTAGGWKMLSDVDVKTEKLVNIVTKWWTNTVINCELMKTGLCWNTASRPVLQCIAVHLLKKDGRRIGD